MSDWHLTISSGLLRHLKYWNLVLVGRGFDIVDDLAMVNASLAILPLTSLSHREVECYPILEESHQKDKDFKNQHYPLNLPSRIMHSN